MNGVRGLKRIHVDFNTMISEPIDLVKLAAPGSWQERVLPPLTPSECVVLYDGDGLEVDATIIYDADGWWLATPDPATWHDVIPEATDATTGR